MINRAIFANLLVAVSGAIKDILLTMYLGTNQISDQFMFAFFLVDMLFGLVMGNALMVAATSVYAKRGNARNVRRDSWRILSVSVLLSLMFLMFYHARLALWFLSLALTYPVYYFLCGILLGRKRTFVALVAPALGNAVIAATAVFVYSDHAPLGSGVHILALAYVTGALVSLLFVAVLRPRNLGDGDRPPMFPLAVQFAVYLLLGQAIGLLERLIAGTFGSGSLSALTYAQRISQAVIWIFISAAASISLPRVAQAHAQGRADAIRKELIRGIRFCLWVGVPASVILFTFRHWIVSLVFMRGAFDQHSLTLTSTYLGAYSLSLVFAGLSSYLLKVMTAQGNLLRPLRVVGMSFLVNAIVDIAMKPVVGPYCLGLGALCGSLLSTIWLTSELRNVFRIRVLSGKN